MTKLQKGILAITNLPPQTHTTKNESWGLKYRLSPIKGEAGSIKLELSVPLSHQNRDRHALGAIL